MMKQRSFFTWDKYAKIEVGFFIYIWLITPLFSDLEYNLYELGGSSRDTTQVMIIRRLVWGILDLIPYYLFYRFAIWRLLLQRKYGYFLLSFVIFLLFLDIYMVYGLYWPVSKMSFLPKQLTNEAAKYMAWKGHFHFTVHYVILQLLQLAALAYFISNDRKERQLKQLRQLQTEADLQYLKAQLQPHFFFNTLNNIYALALQRSADTAPLVARMSDMMRYVLYEARESRLPLQKEIAFLQGYIDVQSVRYNDKIAIRFDTQGITEEVLIEPLLLLPYVENAFKHGIEQEPGQGYIDIVICVVEDELTMQVKNSSPSASRSLATASGIGQENARKRLDLLYPGTYSLTMHEATGEYEVVLNIKLHRHEKDQLPAR